MSKTELAQRSASVEAEAYEQRLLDCFRNTADKREAHRCAAPILEEMARSRPFLRSALARYVADPENVNKASYPVLAIDVVSNPYFELVINAWIPLPDGRTDVSTKSIHHHGEMLLTTVTAFGPGYEHWLLARPTEVNPEKHIFHLDLVDSGPHELHSAAFVDAYTAHVPLYPAALTMTICLWSAQQTRTWRDNLKHLPMVRRNRALLRQAAVRLGLSRALQVKTVSYFDFYPTPEGFVGIAERDEFKRGPNADHLQSLFHVLQETGNQDLGESIAAHIDAESLESPDVAQDLLDQLGRGEPIAGRLSEGQYNVPTANFTRSEIEQSLLAQDQRAPVAERPARVPSAR